jgi:hypothetical protein
MEPIKTDMESSIDLIGSPIQSQEQNTTQIKVNSRISNDFLEKMCLIIFLKFDIFVSQFPIKITKYYSTKKNLLL